MLTSLLSQTYRKCRRLTTFHVYPITQSILRFFYEYGAGGLALALTVAVKACFAQNGFLGRHIATCIMFPEARLLPREGEWRWHPQIACFSNCG